MSLAISGSTTSKGAAQRSRRLLSWTHGRSRTTSTMRAAASVGFWATMTPAASRAAILPFAVPRSLPGDNGPGVSHLPALWSGRAGDVGNDGLGHLRCDELCCALLFGATDLADHDDGLRRGIGLERVQAIDEIRAGHRVTADPDACRLTDPLLGELVESLVEHGPRPADKSDRTAAERDVGRGDADVRLARPR